jgi:hypothetical protein
MSSHGIKHHHLINLWTFSDTVHSRSDFFEIMFEILIKEAAAVETVRAVGVEEVQRRVTWNWAYVSSNWW